MANVRRNSFTTNIMGHIDSVVKRSNKNKEGIYESATFELWGKQYKMSNDGLLSYSDGRKVSISWAKCGIYPEYSLTGSDSDQNIALKAYHMSLLCLTDWFYEAYMSDSGAVVNHTVVEKFNHDFFNVGSTYTSASKPLREVSFNPMYLEVITRSRNSIHGHFVTNNELFGVFVSALDVEQLELVLYNLYRLSNDVSSECKKLAVESYYRAKGETKKLIFA